MLPARSEIIHGRHARGERVAAVFPIHYPRALFYAFDILPIEVWGPPKMDPNLGAAHLQPYICSIVRNALAFQLSGGLDSADILVVPHACDSLQGLGSILIDFIHPKQPVLTIYLPRGNRESGLEFLADEFRALYRQLAEITGCQPSDAELMASIRADERADQLLAQLHRQRRTLPLAQLELYRLIRSREFLPVEDFCKLAESTLMTAASANGGIPIIHSGYVPEPMEMLRALSESGGLVVADDLACCGRRVYPPGTSDDPFVRMAERILNAPPDSTRGSPIQDRLEHLLRMANDSGAKGIVFYNVKFCEPELFYLPTLRKGLESAGVPSLVVETDVSDPLTHQVVTRLEAFLEMIA
ncbi:MAG: 2-hydroxyacyl-CoA dehydratase [Chloroflexi bacterium]|nr:2-hydroxyacyl-CoA dehydratase [Chloroflexota bacterium]